MASFSHTFGPLVITGTPSSTTSSVLVVVTIGGNTVVQNNVTVDNPNLIWTNSVVGIYTTSGSLTAYFGGGTDTNALQANTLTWYSPRGGTGNASGQVGQW